MSLACAVNFGLAGALAIGVPQYSNVLQNQHLKLLGAFAGLDVVAAFMVWMLMRSPEEAVSLDR